MRCSVMWKFGLLNFEIGAQRSGEDRAVKGQSTLVAIDRNRWSPAGLMTQALYGERRNLRD